MEPVQILLIVVAVTYVIGRRLSGEPLQGKRLIVLPAALVIYGVSQLHHLGPAAAVVLVVEGLIAFGLGAVRGVTIAVYERNGHLWYRYRPLTIVVWIVTIAARVGLVFGAHLVGVDLPTTASILVGFGISLFGEAAVVAAKAQRSGVPYAPDKRTLRADRSG